MSVRAGQEQTNFQTSQAPRPSSFLWTVFLADWRAAPHKPRVSVTFLWGRRNMVQLLVVLLAWLSLSIPVALFVAAIIAGPRDRRNVMAAPLIGEGDVLAGRAEAITLPTR